MNDQALYIGQLLEQSRLMGRDVLLGLYAFRQEGGRLEYGDNRSRPILVIGRNSPHFCAEFFHLPADIWENIDFIVNFTPIK